jgi:hypothetical protein
MRNAATAEPLAVNYQGRLAALVTDEGPAELLPHIAVLEPDHPIRWFVRLMMVDAAMAIDADAPESFDSEHAEMVARRTLI